MKDFKEKTIRGGLAKVLAQAAIFCLRLGSVMVLARLLDPKDFGLVGMVTAFTGILNLFRDFGLSAAAVQRVKVSEEQVSTLFWINVLVGVGLTLVTIAAAPAIAHFYHEPRLIWVTIVLSSGFLINSSGVQHSALLQRQMRFTAMAGIDVLSLAISVMVGIAMALRGFGYWALVATALVPTGVTATCLWIASGWLPGRPRRGVGVRSMLRFGGTLTLNSIIVYIAYNLDKVLLGRWWGAQAVGLYGRAYQLINIPTENLNTAAGEVAFPALSRVQDDPVLLKRYFLKGYSLILGLTVPITIACALFANDLISVVLGPKWHEAIRIFRLLSPTILIIALINPLIWLVLSLGMVGRSLRIGLVYAPIVVIGCVVGLPYGPAGVAMGYSTVLTLWCIPHIAWAVHGTVVSLKDILRSASGPLLSGLAGAVSAASLQFLYADKVSALVRLVLGSLILGTVYVWMLLYVMGHKAFYVDLMARMLGRGSKEDTHTAMPHDPERTFERGNDASGDIRNGDSSPRTDALFIAVDYKPNSGGIAGYLDALTRGLNEIGRNAKMLALYEPNDTDRRVFLENYEDWVIPFEITHDARPKNWLGNKCVSALEILRCKSRLARQFLDDTRWFRTSTETVARLEDVLRKEQPAAVVIGHLYLSFYPLVLHLMATGRPYGIIAHDTEFFRYQNNINDRIRRGMMIRGAAWIVANSHHTKALVRSWGFPEDRIAIVHPPLTAEALSVPHKVNHSPFKIPYTLVTVSRIVRSKGHDTVLQAMKLLARANVPCRYLILGRGPEQPALEKLAAELGLSDKVEFAGFVPESEKWRLLQSADVYVMPSRVNLNEAHEGFGIAFLEAAACGLPSVGSRAGGIEDAVVDGVTGILVPPDSPEQLADALLSLYRDADLREKMAVAGLERARSQFSPHAIATRFQNEILRRPAAVAAHSTRATTANAGVGSSK